MGDDLKIFDNDPYETPQSALDESVAYADPPDPLTAEHEYLAPDGRRKAAQALLGVTIALNLIDLVVLLVFYQPLDAAYSDDTYGDAATEALGAYGIMSILTVLVSMAYFTVFLTWLYRAYRNLYFLSTEADPPPRYTPGWAVGCWFVPIMNLFRPAQVMGDVFGISDPSPAATAPHTMSRLVQAWWAAWLLSSVFANIAVRIDNIDLLVASEALDLLSRVLTFLVIHGAAKLQAAKYAAVTRRAQPSIEAIFSR